MVTTGNEDPIGHNELLLRRIPVASEWVDLTRIPPLQSLAYRPHKKRDISGLSLSRMGSADHPEFLSIEDFAEGPSSPGYYVAFLRVGDLRAEGIEIRLKPLKDNPGHVELPQLTAENRKTDKGLELQKKLTNLTIRVEGPFVNPPS